MNVHEAAAVLAYMGSAWPKWDMTDDNADVWATELAGCHVDVAREAARNLIQTSKFAPSIAEFLEECRRIRTARSIAKPLPAISAPSEKVDPTDIIARLRDQLADASARKHNHKGPDPCPVCTNRKDPAA